MPKPVDLTSPAAAIVTEESALWQRVLNFLTQNAQAAANEAGRDRSVPDQTDAELLELRDALAEAKPEDIAPLIEQMTRLSAVAAGRRGKVVAPVDIQAPYFAHLRLKPSHPPKAAPRDVLIGRRGFIDRGAGIQIVDWRDAPVSQIYYRYDEGDDYDELIGGTVFQGVVEARRNVTIQGGKLRRIGCPQGTFFCDDAGSWWEADAAVLPTLAGGQGLAARAPRPAGPPPKATSSRTPSGKPAAAAPSAEPRVPGPAAFAGRSDKHLPEIAALIDPDQFDLITKPDSGVVVIQGGAGSGKTTVALHRVAYLAYQKPDRFRGSKVMVVVPSEALVRYVSGVLPALGVTGVPVQTSVGWMRHHRKRLLPHLPDQRPDPVSGQALSDTPPVVSRLKKHPGMLRLLEGYVADQATQARATIERALAEQPAIQARVLAEWDARARRPLRLRCRGVRHILDKEGLSKDKEREKGADSDAGLAQRLDELLRRLWRRAGDVTRDWAEALTDPERLWRELGPSSPAHLVHAPVTRSEITEFVTYCQRQQEEVEELPEDMDPERFQAVDGKPLDEDNPAGQLDVEDDPLLLYLYQLKYGGLEHSASQSARRKAGDAKAPAKPSSGKDFVRYEHLVLDEVQDLSAVEVKVLISCVGPEDKPEKDPRTGRLPEPSITMAGDVAQRLVFDNGFVRWEDLLRTVGLRAQIQRLRIMYRSTAEVMALSHAVLGNLLTDDSVQTASRHGAPVRAFRFDEVGEAVAFLGEALRSLLLREPTASVALISRHSGTATAFFQGLQRADVPALRRVARNEFTFAAGVDVTDVTQVKGLEFDYVVVLDATEAAYPDTIESRHLLHIAMTRSAHQLWLLASGAPSPLIPPSYFADETAAITDNGAVIPA